MDAVVGAAGAGCDAVAGGGSGGLAGLSHAKLVMISENPATPTAARAAHGRVLMRRIVGRSRPRCKAHDPARRQAKIANAGGGAV